MKAGRYLSQRAPRKSWSRSETDKALIEPERAENDFVGFYCLPTCRSASEMEKKEVLIRSRVEIHCIGYIRIDARTEDRSKAQYRVRPPNEKNHS